MDVINIAKCGGSKSFYDNIHSMVIEWLLTYHCNYRCTYCKEPTDKPEQSLSLEQTMNVVDFITLSIPYQKTITLLGGEPTCNPHYLKIVERINKNITNDKTLLCIFSNASQSTKTFLDSIEIYDRTKNVLLYSYHPVKTDDEQFLIKIKTLHDFGFSYKINAMMEMNQFGRLQRFYEKVRPYINNKTQLIEFIPLEPFGNYTYSDEYRKFGKDMNALIPTEGDIDVEYQIFDGYYMKFEKYTQGALKFLPSSYFDFHGMHCAAWTQLGISPDGKVSTRCNISPKRSDPNIQIYDVFTEQKEILDTIKKQIICPFDNCPRNDVLCSLKSTEPFIPKEIIME